MRSFNHPLIADIKRKDFIAISPLSIAEVTELGLVKLTGKRFATSVPFMRFLCEAVDALIDCTCARHELMVGMWLLKMY